MGTDQNHQPHDGEFADQPLSPEELAQIEAQAAEDAAAFGMEGAASTAQISVEVERKSSSKMLYLWLAVGAISVMLVTCITIGVVAVLFFGRTPAPNAEDIAKKKQLPPVKEIEAKIKNIDREQRTIKLLVGPGKYQTFRITPDTEFRDAAGSPLAQGLDAPALVVEDVVLILPTEDRQGLQYLKLSK